VVLKQLKKMDLKGKIKKQRKRENKHSWLKTYVDPKRAIF